MSPTFGVTNTNDSGANSLRNAITQANTTLGVDIIDLTGIAGTIALATPLPTINNLIGNSGAGSGFTNGVNGDRVGTAAIPIDPNLGALANNGGPTQTHAPNLGSLAIDRGNNATIASDLDQRGLIRFSGSAVDIGAVEVQQIVSITAPDNSATETPIDPGTFRISRSDSTIGNLTVNLAIDGSSTAVAADYNLGSTFPVTIPDGQSFVDVILTPVDDAIPEVAETLRLNLGVGNYAIAPTSNNATVTIAANDAISYAIALTNPATGSLTEGNSGTKPVSFTVTRSGGTAVPSKVDYAIAGTATNGADYNNINAAGATTATGTIAFAANETSKTISLDVLGDTLVELDETISVTLSNPNLTAAPESSTVTANTATVTIANDDISRSSISIGDVTVTEGNTGTVNANFTVSLSAASSLPVTLNYATSDGTANTADSDYAAVTGSLTFNAGETTKTITVAVNGDSKFEADETFNVNLNTPVNATIIRGPNQTNNNINGTESNDILLGSNRNENINGLGGNDLLVGFTGDDNIYGGINSDVPVGRGKDDDRILGNEGDDYLNGLAGEDLIFAGENDDVVYGGKDNDIIFGDKESDTLIGDDSNDTLYGGTLNSLDIDSTGRDLLFGLAGNDYLNGQEAADSLSGGIGNDTVRGGKGDDLALGDLGNDLLFGDEGSDTLCGGDGEDTMYGDIGSPLAIGSTDGKDQICGGEGNDWLFGNEGQDTVCGDAGNDTLDGGKDDDSLLGGAGNDWLFGDEGNDTLIGGTGSDRFILGLDLGSETILDFQSGRDAIGLIGGLSFSQLSITVENNSTLIRVTSSSQLLATLTNVPAGLINVTDFAIL